jgi:hypothetical protein
MIVGFVAVVDLLHRCYVKRRYTVSVSTKLAKAYADRHQFSLALFCIRLVQSVEVMSMYITDPSQTP